ncbi:hypothetical protein D3C87_2147500 [compost metagenome]
MNPLTGQVYRFRGLSDQRDGRERLGDLRLLYAHDPAQHPIRFVLLAIRLDRDLAVLGIMDEGIRWEGLVFAFG